MDLNALLAARESDGASGENLEYDADFMELQRLSLPGEERQVGNEIVPGEDPDFADVEGRALAVLERSHDLRAAVILADARLNIRGLAGFADAVAYIRGVLEQHWATCHPQLDADDDDDPTMRINAVAGLNSALTARYLRRTPLTQSRTFGRVTLRDIQIATGEIPAPEGKTPAFDRATIAAAFADTAPDVVSALLAEAKRLQADLRGIEAVFAAQTPGQGPDLDDLRKSVAQMVRHLSENAAEDAAAEPAEGEDAAEDDSSAAPVARRGGGGGPMGSIETAQDARGAIDRLIDYFKRNEPSSPVPIILERAKRLVGADFLTIIKDLAPDGMDSVRNIGGIKDEDDD
ncbi:type VI secretion system protein TssA [bacterium]|nr:type VI secretion system protein TssA [bacterium]